MQVGVPRIQTVVKIWRTSTAYKTVEKEICSHLGSEPFDRRPPGQWLGLVRGHWGGLEIRNHGRKDAGLLEGKTRSRNPMVVGALAMLRNVLLCSCTRSKTSAKRYPGSQRILPRIQTRLFQCRCTDTELIWKDHENFPLACCLVDSLLSSMG